MTYKEHEIVETSDETVAEAIEETEKLFGLPERGKVRRLIDFFKYPWVINSIEQVMGNDKKLAAHDPSRNVFYLPKELRRDHLIHEAVHHLVKVRGLNLELSESGGGFYNRLVVETLANLAPFQIYGVDAEAMDLDPKGVREMLRFNKRMLNETERIQKTPVNISILRHRILEKQSLETGEPCGKDFFDYFYGLGLKEGEDTFAHSRGLIGYLSFSNAVALLDRGYKTCDLVKKIKEATSSGEDEERFYFGKLVPMVHQRLDSQPDIEEYPSEVIYTSQGIILRR